MILRRGLSADPGQRPSAAELVAAVRPKRRIHLALGSVALAASVLGWGLWPAGESCSGGPAKLSGAWSDEIRERVHGAISSVGGTWTLPVAERTVQSLERYTNDWLEMYREACSATTIRGEQSAQILDLRMACLARARDRIAASTATLSEADVDVVRNAHELVSALPSLERCADVPRLRRASEYGFRDDGPSYLAVRTALDRTKAELDAGRFPRAATELASAERERDEVSGALAAELVAVRGRLLSEQGRYDEAEGVLRQALLQTLATSQHELAGTVVSQLMFIVGVRQANAPETLRYLEILQGLAEGDEERLIAIDQVLATIWLREDPVRAKEAAWRALSSSLESSGPDFTEVARARGVYVAALAETGHLHEARQQAERSNREFELALGASHPDTVRNLINLARVVGQLGQHDRSLPLYRRVLSGLEDSLGPNHPELAKARNNYAVALMRAGKYDEAKTHLQDSLAVLEDIFPPEHGLVQGTMHNLLSIMQADGGTQEAVALARDLLQIREHALGLEPSARPETRSALALKRSRQWQRPGTGGSEDCVSRGICFRKGTAGVRHRESA